MREFITDCLLPWRQLCCHGDGDYDAMEIAMATGCCCSDSYGNGVAIETAIATGCEGLCADVVCVRVKGHVLYYGCVI